MNVHFQGKRFWANFTVNFLSHAVKFGEMKEHENPKRVLEVMDKLFCIVMDQFILGKNFDKNHKIFTLEIKDCRGSVKWMRESL